MYGKQTLCERSKFESILERLLFEFDELIIIAQSVFVTNNFKLQTSKVWMWMCVHVGV